MSNRKDHGTRLLWGLAANEFASQCGVFRTRKQAQVSADILNRPYAMEILEPVRVTLSWERPVRKRRAGGSTGSRE